MLIVELNGTPGCGKSTLCDRVLEELESRGITAGTLRDVVFRKQRGKLSNFVQMALILLSFRRRKLTFATIKMALDYGLDKTRLLFAFRFLKLIGKLGETIKDGHYPLLLLEEGIIQFITSIPHDTRLKQTDSFNIVCEQVQSLYADVLQVNCHLDFEENVKRTRQRGSLKRRFDQLPENQLRDALLVKRDNIDLVRRKLVSRKIIDINMMEDIESASDRLVRAIMEDLNNREMPR